MNDQNQLFLDMVLDNISKYWVNLFPLFPLALLLKISVAFRQLDM